MHTAEVVTTFPRCELPVWVITKPFAGKTSSFFVVLVKLEPRELLEQILLEIARTFSVVIRHVRGQKRQRRLKRLSSFNLRLTWSSGLLMLEFSSPTRLWSTREVSALTESPSVFWTSSAVRSRRWMWLTGHLDGISVWMWSLKLSFWRLLLHTEHFTSS